MMFETISYANTRPAIDRRYDELNVRRAPASASRMVARGAASVRTSGASCANHHANAAIAARSAAHTSSRLGAPSASTLHPVTALPTTPPTMPPAPTNP